MTIDTSSPSTTQPLKPVTWSWLVQHPARLIAFGFGSGLAPFAPGTIGTLWAWAAGLMLYHFYQPSVLETAVYLLIGFLIGVWVCGITGHDLGQPDHGGMVWDEIIAFWIVLSFLLPASFWSQLLGFALFRFFDAVKPGPIKTIDQFFKHWRPQSAFDERWELTIRGFGVMIDDLAAALATLLTLAILYRVF